jgi:Mg2+/citrate symporter
MKGIDPKILVAIIIIMAVVLFSIMLATGAIKPVQDLLSKEKIADVLGIFGVKSS